MLVSMKGVNKILGFVVCLFLGGTVFKMSRPGKEIPPCLHASNTCHSFVEAAGPWIRDELQQER